MPDALTAAELVALASITDAAGRINAHLTALKALAASVPCPVLPRQMRETENVTTAVPSIPPAPLERVPLNPVPPIRASLIGEPMQQGPAPAAKPLTALDLARYQVPGGGEIKPDHGS